MSVGIFLNGQYINDEYMRMRLLSEDAKDIIPMTPSSDMIDGADKKAALVQTLLTKINTMIPRYSMEDLADKIMEIVESDPDAYSPLIDMTKNEIIAIFYLACKGRLSRKIIKSIITSTEYSSRTEKIISLLSMKEDTDDKPHIFRTLQGATDRLKMMGKNDEYDEDVLKASLCSDKYDGKMFAYIGYMQYRCNLNNDLFRYCMKIRRDSGRNFFIDSDFDHMDDSRANNFASAMKELSDRTYNIGRSFLSDRRTTDLQKATQLLDIFSINDILYPRFGKNICSTNIKAKIDKFIEQHIMDFLVNDIPSWIASGNPELSNAISKGNTALQVVIRNLIRLGGIESAYGFDHWFISEKVYDGMHANILRIDLRSIFINAFVEIVGNMVEANADNFFRKHYRDTVEVHDGDISYMLARAFADEFNQKAGRYYKDHNDGYYELSAGEQSNGIHNIYDRMNLFIEGKDTSTAKSTKDYYDAYLNGDDNAVTSIPYGKSADMPYDMLDIVKNAEDIISQFKSIENPTQANKDDNSLSLAIDAILGEFGSSSHDPNGLTNKHFYDNCMLHSGVENNSWGYIKPTLYGYDAIRRFDMMVTDDGEKYYINSLGTMLSGDVDMLGIMIDHIDGLDSLSDITLEALTRSQESAENCLSRILAAINDMHIDDILPSSSEFEIVQFEICKRLMRNYISCYLMADGRLNPDDDIHESVFFLDKNDDISKLIRGAYYMRYSYYYADKVMKAMKSSESYYYLMTDATKLDAGWTALASYYGAMPLLSSVIGAMAWSEATVDNFWNSLFNWRWDMIQPTDKIATSGNLLDCMSRYSLI